MENQIHIQRVDRRKIVRILIDYIKPEAFLKDAPAEVTDEMIESAIHPKQALNVEHLFGRPLHITEVDRIVDLREYLEYVGPFPNRVVREIGEKVRELTGASLI